MGVAQVLLLLQLLWTAPTLTSEAREMLKELEPEVQFLALHGSPRTTGVTPRWAKGRKYIYFQILYIHIYYPTNQSSSDLALLSGLKNHQS